MTNERVIELLKIEMECICRQDTPDCQRCIDPFLGCKGCDLVQDTEELLKAYRKAIQTLDKKIPYKHPTIEEVQDYIAVMGYSVDAQRFFDYYESNGWIVGKTKMKDWKAAVRGWESRNKSYSTPTRPTPQTKINPFAD